MPLAAAAAHRGLDESDVRQSTYFGYLSDKIREGAGETFAVFNHTGDKIEWRLDDKGVPLAPGQRGLLAIRSETRFSGYWRRPPEQQARFEDGFFVTGDLGFIDGEGNVSIAGRTGDVIISGGYNVYPKEVELALEQMDSLAQVAVFALPHPDFGEAVAAAVVVRPGRLLEPQDIAAALKLRLASYKIPKAIFQLEALPVTELGKVQRRVLAQRFAGHFAPSPAHAAP